MKKILIAFMTILSVFAYTGCGDDFLNRTDNRSINSGSFYQSDADAIASVNAVYAPLQNRGLWARSFHFFLDFSSGEVDPTPNTQGPPFELIQHTFGPAGNEHIERPWDKFYEIIAKANITIKNTVNNENVTAEAKDQVLGQAKFLRALSYFYINTLWNGGPLRTEENDTEVSVPRGTPDAIWSLIEGDLMEAKSKLPATWDAADAGRATRGAAQALLGKAYLYQGMNSEAETELMGVVGMPEYGLVGEGAATIDEAVVAMRSNHDFGVKNNAEAVFEVQFASGVGGFSWSGNSTGRQEGSVRAREYGVDGFSFYNSKPSQALIDAFERTVPGSDNWGEVDPRMHAFFFTKYDTLVNSADEKIPYDDIFQNGSGYAWKKYQLDQKVQNPNDPNDNDTNHDVIRYSDVVLMAAEAKIYNNKPGEALDLINRIRRRADPTGTILPDRTDQSMALDYLKHERQIELCCEQVRRMDLVRWGDAAANIAGFQAGKHEYFPIPQAEIDANEEINENNPGY